MSQKSKKNEERENTLDKSSPMHTVRECSLFYELGMHHSDRELVLAFQAGKYHCFETLYERALPKVYRYLLLDLSMQAWVFLDFLETLGEEKKDIVVMRIWEDLSYQEIAQVLGKSEEACRQLFSRTMKALCNHFKS